MPRCFNRCWKSSREKMKIKNLITFLSDATSSLSDAQCPNRLGCPRFPCMRVVNCEFANHSFGASDPQIRKSQNLTFCVPDVPPKFVVLLTSIRINTPPAALPPLPPILPLHPRNLAPDLAQDTILRRLPPPPAAITAAAVTFVVASAAVAFVVFPRLRG